MSNTPAPDASPTVKPTARTERSTAIDDAWRAPPTALVIFGASGDLTRRKLGPALFNLWREGYLAEPFVIIGAARREKSHQQFRDELRQGCVENSRLGAPAQENWDAFSSNVFYVRGDLGDPALYHNIERCLAAAEAKFNAVLNRLFYLSVAPRLFSTAGKGLVESGLIRREIKPDAGRVVVEKPFGRDLQSAMDLNADLLELLDESQIYRIDHYLGKTTVQDILAFRFGNSIFEPLFNRRYVDHVQITVAETVGMEGGRGAYYDSAGALRDMMQNHLLQLLCLAAMEPPASFEADSIHNEKVKVLRALSFPGASKDDDIIRGQYGAGKLDGQAVRAYRDEANVAPDSTTETYVALRLAIENWRWAGVPFFLRTGKRMARRASEIAVQFLQPPLRLFEAVGPEGDRCDLSQAQPNRLIFRVQPDEGISLSFASMTPGMEFQLQNVQMDFDYRDGNSAALPEAYERLLLDAMRGDSSLFTRADEVEHAWRFIDSIRALWDNSPPPDFPNYVPGSDGPDPANRLFAGRRASWRSL